MLGERNWKVYCLWPLLLKFATEAFHNSVVENIQYLTVATCPVLQNSIVQFVMY